MRIDLTELFLVALLGQGTPMGDEMLASVYKINSKEQFITEREMVQSCNYYCLVLQTQNFWQMTTQMQDLNLNDSVER